MGAIVQQAITDRRTLIDALHRAADLEHDVVCRYLFAAFSLKADVEEGGVTALQLEEVREWRAVLLRVAREEMGHLGFVCNLLTAVGAPARFDPPRRLTLRPFSTEALDAFIRIERDHDAAAGAGSIGALYDAIRAAFRRLGAENPLLFVGRADAQVDNASLDLPPGWFDFRLHPVVDVESAERAVAQVLEESGEDDGHAAAFEGVREAFERQRESVPDFDPVRSVVPGTTLGDGPGRLVEPVTRAAAELFNAAYEVMLSMMLRFYTPAAETEVERAALQKTAFFPLMTMVLRPLGELLTRMPVRGAESAPTAGPTFECRRDLNLSPHPLSAWTNLQERLDELDRRSADVADAVRDVDRPWSAPLCERFDFVHQNVARIATDFRRRMNAEPDQVRHLLRRIL